jgi:hypothetical protein
LNSVLLGTSAVYNIFIKAIVSPNPNTTLGS